jgi:uncharacterized membrane protein YvlD (DUF360 family)
MKKTIYSILLYILAFSFSIEFFNGVSLPGEPLYWLATVVIFAIVVLLHKPVLKFLTIKINFVTFWLAAAILSAAAFYTLELIMPDFIVGVSSFEGLSTGSVTINSFELTELATMFVASFVYGGICSLMETLRGNEE